MCGAITLRTPNSCMQLAHGARILKYFGAVKKKSNIEKTGTL